MMCGKCQLPHIGALIRSFIDESAGADGVAKGRTHPLGGIEVSRRKWFSDQSARVGIDALAPDAAGTISIEQQIEHARIKRPAAWPTGRRRFINRHDIVVDDRAIGRKSYDETLPCVAALLPEGKPAIVGRRVW